MLKDNCEQQKPYVRMKYRFVVAGKKLQQRKLELMKRHTILHWQKAPEDYWLFPPHSKFFFIHMNASTQALSIFHEISYVATCPSDKFISCAYTLLMDSWIECNKRLSHWCSWYELCHFQAVARGIILIKRKTLGSVLRFCYHRHSCAQSFNCLGVLYKQWQISFSELEKSNWIIHQSLSWMHVWRVC